MIQHLWTVKLYLYNAMLLFNTMSSGRSSRSVTKVPKSHPTALPHPVKL